MQTRQFCSDAARTNCVSGSAINPAVHLFPAPEFCRDAELTDCVAGAAVTAAHTFSGVRWCNNANHQEDSILTIPRVNFCQRKKIGAFIHAKHIGLTVNGTVPARQSEGNIQVQSINAAGGNITGITIGGFGAGAGGTLRGLTIGGFGAGAPTIRGIVVGGFGAGGHDVEGGIVAPFYFKIESERDGELGHVKGVSISAFNHIKGEQFGLSIGVLNYAWELHGVQIGVLNYARNNRKGLRLLPIFNREW